MTINERVALVREDSGLSMEKFGNRIGITRSSIHMIENGTNNPSRQTIDLICREFRISRDWMETGEGEMKLLDIDEETALFNELSNTSTASAQAIRMAIKYYFHLDAEGRKIIDGLVESLLGQ